MVVVDYGHAKAALNALAQRHHITYVAAASYVLENLTVLPLFPIIK
jgi:hypothetical protein